MCAALENGTNFVTRDRAAVTVVLCDQCLEGLLTHSLRRERRFADRRAVDCERRSSDLQVLPQHGLEDRFSRSEFDEIVGAPAHDVRCELARWREDLTRAEEDDVSEQHCADLGILIGLDRHFSVLLDPRAKLRL